MLKTYCSAPLTKPRKGKCVELALYADSYTITITKPSQAEADADTPVKKNQVWMEIKKHIVPR